MRKKHGDSSSFSSLVFENTVEIEDEDEHEGRWLAVVFTQFGQSVLMDCPGQNARTNVRGDSTVTA